SGVSLRLLRRPDARSERIPWIRRHVGNATPLNAVTRPHRSFGEDVAIGITVVSRIGVDQAANGAMLRGDLRLDPAPRAAVLGDDNCAFHGDAVSLELLVVRGHAIVHEDKWTRDVSVDRVRI